MIQQKRKGDKFIEAINENSEKKEEEKEIYTSKKPLWIQDVKKSIQYFPLSINELEFEKIEDIMNEENNDSIINHEEHPYYSTIRKIMYAFGDVKDPNKKTIIKISNFINTYISLLIQIIQECDYKKIIEYFFKAEKEKLDSIKKYKHRSFFSNNIFNKKEMELSFFGANNEENNEENNNLEDEEDSLEEFNIYGDEEENNENKFIKKEKMNNINNANNIDNIFELNSENNLIENGKNKTLNVNLFNKDKDESNREITIFQDKRTELMDTKTYEEYIKCRQHNFLSRGKKYFQNFLQNLGKDDKFPNELKESSNVELIAFILNEEIKKIITNSIKNKHPNKKLFILTQPLSPNDIEFFCNKEIQILANFLDNFHNDIFMINEFKKKKINKIYNKNTKVKNGKNGEINLIIKKFAFIHDQEESEFLSKIKSNSETQVINGIIKLREQLIKAKNQKIMKEGLRNNKTNISYQNKFISIKEMIDFIGVENYYEYFLSKDYIRNINLEEIKLNEFNSYLSKLNKISKKKISSKFDCWLNLNPDQKEEIKNEFKNLTSDVIQL